MPPSQGRFLKFFRKEIFVHPQFFGLVGTKSLGVFMGFHPIPRWGRFLKFFRKEILVHPRFFGSVVIITLGGYGVPPHAPVGEIPQVFP